jgi:hypothetical protein
MTIFVIDFLLYLFLGTNIIINTLFSNTLKEWCTNPVRKFAMANEFFALANIRGHSVWDLFIFITLEPRIFGGP